MGLGENGTWPTMRAQGAGRAGGRLLLLSGHHPALSFTLRAEHRAALPDPQPQAGLDLGSRKWLLPQISSASAPEADRALTAECRYHCHPPDRY